MVPSMRFWQTINSEWYVWYTEDFEGLGDEACNLCVLDLLDGLGGHHGLWFLNLTLYFKYKVISPAFTNTQKYYYQLRYPVIRLRPIFRYSSFFWHKGLWIIFILHSFHGIISNTITSAKKYSIDFHNSSIYHSCIRYSLSYLLFDRFWLSFCISLCLIDLTCLDQAC
jgi:hypothetical protein